MKRSIMLWMALGALFLAFASSAPRVGEANHPAVNPQPLLFCADVNGDGAASVGDIQRVVGKFGTNDPAGRSNATYQPLFDLTTPPGANGSGAVAVGDILVTVSDFGQMCPLVDTQIARATLDIIDPMYHPSVGPDFAGDAGLIFENASLLASKGYFLSSTDVPGQGKHYINPTYFLGNTFEPTAPDGLVYESGRLAAQLYFIDGDAVGWGCWPGCSDNPPADQVDIDNVPGGTWNMVPGCSPSPCSWDGGHDEWHLHYNLCTVAIGTPNAAAISGVTSAANCEAIHNTWCGGSKCGGSYTWKARVGWMGHLWNNLLNPNVNDADILGNGRFTDCFPDAWTMPTPGHWDGYNCPQ
ncbi:MAG: hypothetical protein WBD55_00150 [Dehalococcoidia bacterium]